MDEKEMGTEDVVQIYLLQDKVHWLERNTGAPQQAGKYVAI